jgi:isoleucyl-tRNA synthetase
VYFDILKDRLYTFAPKSVGRRSAQTALYEIVDRFARLIAPILAFTADEVWENSPGRNEASVHMAEFPETGEAESELLATWNKLFEVRSAVQKALEAKRNEKLIGASLEAKVTLRAGGDTLALLDRYKDQLTAILIVSQVEVEKGERCWNWSETVGRDERFPTLDERCVRQVEEGWGSGR